MENIQILPQRQQYRIQRCGTEVLRIITPGVLGTAPAAAHMIAIIAALTRHAEEKLTLEAERALREAIAQKRLLHFSHHEVRITLTAKKLQRCLCLTLTYVHKSGDTVYKNDTLVTYWSEDGSIQYARPPRRSQGALTARKQKRISLFSRATLRTRAKCDKI